MKHFLSIALLSFFALFVSAKQIDEVTAKRVGCAFLVNRTAFKQVGLKPSSLKLAYQASGKQVYQSMDLKEMIYFYVFNVDYGFVIVSGDDLAIPVLGYSIESTFDSSNIPPNALKWFEGYKDEIRYVIEKNIPISPENAVQWHALINNTSSVSPAARPMGTSIAAERTF